jgi:hypothetical protein
MSYLKIEICDAEQGGRDHVVQLPAGFTSAPLTSYSQNNHRKLLQASTSVPQEPT